VPTPGDDAMSITFSPNSINTFANIRWGAVTPLHADLRPQGPGSVRIIVTFSAATNAGDSFLVNLQGPAGQVAGIGGTLTGPGQYISRELLPFELDVLDEVNLIRFAIFNRSNVAKTFSISNIEIVPEPATAALVGIGLAALAGMRKKRAA
jgi:hypothetical protein